MEEFSSCESDEHNAIASVPQQIRLDRRSRRRRRKTKRRKQHDSEQPSDESHTDTTSDMTEIEMRDLGTVSVRLDNISSHVPWEDRFDPFIVSAISFIFFGITGGVCIAYVAATPINVPAVVMSSVFGAPFALGLLFEICFRWPFLCTRKSLAKQLFALKMARLRQASLADQCLTSVQLWEVFCIRLPATVAFDSYQAGILQVEFDRSQSAEKFSVFVRGERFPTRWLPRGVSPWHPHGRRFGENGIKFDSHHMMIFRRRQDEQACTRARAVESDEFDDDVDGIAEFDDYDCDSGGGSGGGS